MRTLWIIALSLTVFAGQAQEQTQAQEQGVEATFMPIGRVLVVADVMRVADLPKIGARTLPTETTETTETTLPTEPAQAARSTEVVAKRDEIDRVILDSISKESAQAARAEFADRLAEITDMSGLMALINELKANSVPQSEVDRLICEMYPKSRESKKLESSQ